ncbi:MULTISPECIES: GNAT family N-acetyltransferase [unclassified Shewanella]|uniref:GNAT family N-acetyltransferase n=1 Tax=unclassified Shewanella TaxID=196818 RepID=UPI001BB83125|nr:MULTISPECIES: GNAT family N-acetyltransferase [unclassified Shewanella]GIU16413.1 GNAT family N-acetyltransferase [Shewanella sp. MBTL60-112-B1]GIU36831.1 GNAT family N-acetyltransferase [Shewanella sp. MBTL60-112-B2]
MLWKSLSFSELSLNELYDLLKLRVDVFVVEQNCPYPELDDKDRQSQTQHLLGLNEQGVIQAYARVLAPGVSYPDASIGRVIVAQAARGAGVANTLMQKAIAISSKKWPENNIQLGGQEHLKDFYQQLGFKAVSEMYLEDGIPHVDMLLTLEK